MPIWYVKSGSGVTQFQKNTAYSVGDRVVNNYSDLGTFGRYGSIFVWECTTAGTTHATDWPSWGFAFTPDTTTVTSGSAVFTCRRPGFSSGTTVDWSFAHPYLFWILQGYADRPNNNGDIVYLSNNHSEDWTPYNTYIDWGGGQTTQIHYISVDDSEAPAATPTVGATIYHTTGNITHDHWGYIFGFVFRTDAENVYIENASGPIFDQCIFHLNHATSTKRVYTGFAAANSFSTNAQFFNCQFRFGHTGQGLRTTGTNAYNDVLFRGCSLHASSAAITTLIDAETSSDSTQEIVMENCDWSGAATNVTLVGTGIARFVMKNCKLPASWSGILTAQQNYVWTGKQSLFATDSANTNFRSHVIKGFGSISTETTIVRTGGASDGTTPLSLKLVSTAGTSFPRFILTTDEIVQWNDVVGSQRLVSIEILRDSATALKDDEIWLEVRYFGDSASPLGALAADAKALIGTAADQASSSAAWTTTGMTNPNKQKLSVVFTPQKKGFLHAVVCLAKPSTTVYVDPLLVGHSAS